MNYLIGLCADPSLTFQHIGDPMDYQFEHPEDE